MNNGILKQICLCDVINQLPDVQPIQFNETFLHQEHELYICALGFEDRCLSMGRKLSSYNDFKCTSAIILEYDTNIEDNEMMKPELFKYIDTFSDTIISLQCNNQTYTNELRGLIQSIAEYNPSPSIIFDISVCSSRVLISILKVLLEHDIKLRIVYTEANIYHPTCEEFEENTEKWTTEEGFGVTQGVGHVISSPEYPGSHRENPDLIIAFPTFKPERTRSIIANIDESLLIRPNKQLIWIIGDPHMDDDIRAIRKDMIRKINNIGKEERTIDVSTLQYKKTLEVLEQQIYQQKNLQYHLNISALGSKMQSVGIAFFCYIRPEVSVYQVVS